MYLHFHCVIVCVRNENDVRTISVAQTIARRRRFNGKHNELIRAYAETSAVSSLSGVTAAMAASTM